MKPPSAIMSPATAANALPHPPRATARLGITESQAAKIGLLDRWQAAQKRRATRAARKLGAQAALGDCVSRLLERARTEDWSQRKLAAKIEIPERTFRRIRDLKVDAHVWLPKLNAALARLSPG